jgi:hypothetical protein
MAKVIHQFCHGFGSQSSHPRVAGPDCVRQGEPCKQPIIEPCRVRRAAK